MLRSFKTLAEIFMLFAAVTSLHADERIKIKIKQPPPNMLGIGDMWNLTLENTTKSDLKIYVTGTATEEKDGLISDSILVSESDSSLQAKKWSMVWVDVESNPSSGCGWGTDFTKNCKFLTDLVNALKGHGLEVGIYASYYQWEDIFGKVTNC